MFNNYGAVLKALGDAAGAAAAYRRALALDPNYADALNNLGVIYRMQGEPAKAIEVFRRAAVLKPELAEARRNLRTAYNDLVPAWHFAMMNDKPRNDAYQAAIARLVPGKRVLEIGTGTGLLAMIAARAGAKSVITCEAVAPIAETAREIIALNGLADRIIVIAGHSTDLAVGRGLAERAQVLVTETFSSDLLSEGVLPAIEHAYQQLLTTDGIVIPRAAAAKAYLIGGSEIEGMLFAGPSNGFDLSPFDDFAPPILAASLNNVAHDVLSDDFELLRFDLRAKTFPMGKPPPVSNDNEERRRGRTCAMDPSRSRWGYPLRKPALIRSPRGKPLDANSSPFSSAASRRSRRDGAPCRSPQPSANFGRSGGIEGRRAALGME